MDIVNIDIDNIIDRVRSANSSHKTKKYLYFILSYKEKSCSFAIFFVWVGTYISANNIIL